MRNQALERLDVLVGSWDLTMSDAWFLEPAGTDLHGSATFEWLGDSFIVMRSEIDGHPAWQLSIGHNDSRQAYTVLYHDERGTSRVFAMRFDGGRWTLTREDPDFHQRFIAGVSAGRIAGRWEASEDQGHTWRKDFDLVFDRVRSRT